MNLPFSFETEQDFLGISLIDNQIIDESDLEPKHFHSPKHEKIWAAMRTLRAQDKGVDLPTITEHLRVQGTLEEVGGVAYLVGLADTLATGAYWDQHQDTILERYQQRLIVRNTQKAAKRAFDLDSPDEILGELEGFLTEIKAGTTHNIEQAIESASRYATGEALVRTGYPSLDREFGGFTRNDLTVIGARSSTGKSAFVHTIADNIAKNEGGHVLIFSPDQPIPEVLAMQAAREANTPLARFRHGLAGDEEKQRFLKALKGLREGFLQRVKFKPGLLSLESFQLESIRAIRNGAVAIIVDTVNRLQTAGDKLHPTIVEFGTIAKGIAAEYDVPVIALAQLRRELDFEDRMPSKADLADSPRSLDSDANLMLLLHRNRDPASSRIMEVIVAKAKSDEAGGKSIQLFWNAEFATVQEWS